MKRCPICQHSDLKQLLRLENLPVFCNVLSENKEEAVNCTYGVQNLELCLHCGFVFNSEFEVQKLEYEEDYHAERGSSAYYQEHMNKTVEIIENICSLSNKKILEVGCGTGEFLKLLSERGTALCIGVDPSASEENAEKVRFYQCLFDENFLNDIPDNIDILISRHMIEHISNPLEMLNLFSKSLPVGGLLYLETPRLDWILENKVFYDFPYEHCSYFSDEFMVRMLKAAGFEKLKIELSYSGQYFSILAYKCEELNCLLPMTSLTRNKIENQFLAITQFYSKAKEVLSSQEIWKQYIDIDTTLQLLKIVPLLLNQHF